MLAAENGNLVILKTLIANKALLNTKDKVIESDEYEC
jgi:hypothetical protein